MIPIAFDVLGTCFSLDAAIVALDALFQDQFAAKKINPKLIVEDWFHTSQHASMNDGYLPIYKVFVLNLPRILLIAGITPLDGSSDFTVDSLASVTSTLTAMHPRPSLAACSALLLGSGKFQLMAATNGGDPSTRGLFTRALGEEEAARWKFFSCDSIQIAKPDPRVYDAIWTGFGIGAENRKGWFIASHTWDLFAAKKAGFKTAWVSYEELIPLTELYGTPDVTAVDLEDAARQILALES